MATYLWFYYFTALVEDNVYEILYIELNVRESPPALFALLPGHRAAPGGGLLMLL